MQPLNISGCIFSVPRAGAKMLVIGGDYCVFIGGY